jgi:nitrite reductase/ring-hydroxylating ferredoxin subunit
VAYRSLELLINLEDGYRRVVRIDDREMLLLQEHGERHLCARRCPHAGQILDQAPVSADCITCPRHGIRFSLDDGEPQPDQCERLRVYEIVYEGNSLGIDAPDDR